MQKAILKTIAILMNQTATEITVLIAKQIKIQIIQTDKFKYCLWCKPRRKVGELPYFLFVWMTFIFFF